MEVKAHETADFLTLLERSFYWLVETGIIPKTREGEYILDEIVGSGYRYHAIKAH